MPPVEAAVAAIWAASGMPAPNGSALQIAAANFAEALQAGQAIPRQSDKTIAPMWQPTPP